MPPEPSTNGLRKIAKLPSAGVFENKSVAGFLKCSGFHEQSLSGSGGTGAKPPKQGIKERNSRRDSDCSGGSNWKSAKLVESGSTGGARQNRC